VTGGRYPAPQAKEKKMSRYSIEAEIRALKVLAVIVIPVFLFI
jgi:hypothetical protein